MIIEKYTISVEHNIFKIHWSNSYFKVVHSKKGSHLELKLQGEKDFGTLFLFFCHPTFDPPNLRWRPNECLIKKLEILFHSVNIITIGTYTELRLLSIRRNSVPVSKWLQNRNMRSDTESFMTYSCIEVKRVDIFTPLTWQN